MADTGEVVLLRSTFEIQNKLYSVKLTPNEIYWESLAVSRAAEGPYSQPLVITDDKVDFTRSQTPGEDVICDQVGPVDVPIIQTSYSARSSRICNSSVSCCALWQQPPSVITCSTCGKTIKSESQLVKLTDLVAVRTGGSDDGKNLSARKIPSRSSAVELVPVGSSTSFCVWVVRRVGRHRLRLQKLVFQSSDSTIISHWVEKINEIMDKPEFSRPKSLLVFINPIAGRGKAVTLYNEKVAPLFELANISIQLIRTERKYHARDVIRRHNLDGLDGIVSVGGDGMFAEVAEGLLSRNLMQSGMEFPTLDGPIPRPDLRIGIVPAGSTDTVSYSTQGINDAVTSALHIILGDCLPIDVGTVFHGRRFLKYNFSLLGYGYMGDCILDSEQNRWMGPKRYDWAGFKKLLGNKSYEGEVQFVPNPVPDYHPRDGTFCKTGCQVCLQTTQKLMQQHLASSITDNASCPGDSEVEWQTVRGRFAAVNSFLISCRCRYALEGPAPAAHLGDGCTDLVLIRSCSRFDYTRHLIRCTDKTADQFDFPFIQVFRTSRFRFIPSTCEDAAGGGDGINFAETTSEVKITSAHDLRESSAVNTVWNCDGEVVDEPAIEFRVHPQLIRIFARGVEEDNVDVRSQCVCCM